MKRLLEIIDCHDGEYGTYPDTHTDDDCDKCLETVGNKNLRKVPFMYKDYNDTLHRTYGDGYHQYYVCNACWTQDFEKMEQYKKKYNYLS